MIFLACREVCMLYSQCQSDMEDLLQGNLYSVSESHADVAELADALDLGSSAARRMGSSPFIRTRTHWGCEKMCGRKPHISSQPFTCLPLKGKAREAGASSEENEVYLRGRI